MKPNVSRREEIIKNRAELTDLEAYHAKWNEAEGERQTPQDFPDKCNHRYRKPTDVDQKGRRQGTKWVEESFVR